MELFATLRRRNQARKQREYYAAIYAKYQNFTMIKPATYAANLLVVEDQRNVPGCVVECGTWKGGMIAGMADLLGNERQYFLFDSFEGLPPAEPTKDGAKAVAYQANPNAPEYLDNCTAAKADAIAAMELAGVRYQIFQGWFNDTLPTFQPPEPIAILRLDGDWYDSTMTCLRYLVPHLAPEGIVILDDYGTWDGCSRAVHDYLSQTQSTARIRTPHDVAVIQGLGAP
jgi:O-methyltransferase